MDIRAKHWRGPVQQKSKSTKCKTCIQRWLGGTAQDPDLWNSVILTLLKSCCFVFSACVVLLQVILPAVLFLCRYKRASRVSGLSWVESHCRWLYPSALYWSLQNWWISPTWRQACNPSSEPGHSDCEGRGSGDQLSPHVFLSKTHLWFLIPLLEIHVQEKNQVRRGCVLFIRPCQ